LRFDLAAQVLSDTVNGVEDKGARAPLLQKLGELRLKTEDQLKSELVTLQKEAFNLRFQRASGQLENTARVRAVRRDIARVETFLRQKASVSDSTEAQGSKAPAAKAAPKAEKKTKTAAKKAPAKKAARG